MFESYNNGAITFGEMWVNAINNYISTRMDSADYKTIEEWQPFGDPTLSIGSQSLQPDKPDPPDGPITAKINEEHTYTAVSSDPEGEQIYYLFEWGDGEYSGWIGPYDSNQTGEASHTWTAKNNYEIRVKVKDIHGVQSEWSDPLQISMPKIKILRNNIINNILKNFPNIFSIFK